MSHVPTRHSSPPLSVPLIGSRSLEPTPAFKLDQLWRRLPAARQQTIASALAQMIARQIVAMPVPPFEKEEHDE